MTPLAGTLSRRGFLRTAGCAAGGAIVLAAGGLGGRAWAQGVFGNLYAGPAFEPWRDWRRGRHQGSLALVAAAILASNPHNSQPWLFRVGERHVELFADPSRHLGTIDPFRREMHLGLGCALENIAVAARGLGYRPHGGAPAPRADRAGAPGRRSGPRVARRHPRPPLPHGADVRPRRGAEPGGRRSAPRGRTTLAAPSPRGDQRRPRDAAAQPAHGTRRARPRPGPLGGGGSGPRAHAGRRSIPERVRLSVRLHGGARAAGAATQRARGRADLAATGARI